MLHSKDKITAFSKTRILHCGDNNLPLTEPLIVGILNLTPDSFYDGGNYLSETSYLRRTEKMLEEGASVIDLGAVSTRPGSHEVSEVEELARLLPALKLLTARFPGKVFSVDTFRSNVARIAADTGAGIINDISAGTLDPEMLKTVGTLNLPYILMHMQGTPATMQINPQYSNVAEEVRLFFAEKLEELRNYGLTQIILDPGFGFGKTVQHNYELLQKLHTFKNSEHPVMVGLSRKSMINKLLNISPDEALHATAALNTFALLKGADFLRVHDVKEATQIIRLVKALTPANEPQAS